MRSLVTGATGYIGGRLVPRLLESGHTVRVLVRDEAKTRAHAWSDDVEVSVGDATDADAVRAALEDVDVLYYLLHSIGTGDDFEKTERDMAQGFADAAHDAGVVIGSGSASFEMLRYLTERLPVMVVPRWVTTRIQPIAVRDVLHYLVGSAEMPSDVSRRFDVGGPDVLTYLDMMQRYAAVAGLPRRRILKVPVLSPTLSSHWVGVITPVPASLARPLV
ncbi:MAG: NAD-dependent epimerase/dehydratase family protein, partial [Actinomycetales bacterium]